MPTLPARILTPPLREGDHLTPDEFLRRWEAMPVLKHAELIDGIVHMPSPVSSPHSGFHWQLAIWLGTYANNTPGCDGGMDGTWLMDDRSVPQPDLALRIAAERGGQSRIEGEYPVGAPELVLEVAVSSAARDLGAKLKLYERNGVREYLIAVTGKQQFLWKELTEPGYQPLDPSEDGIIRSRCFPGLWLDPDALWRCDWKRLDDVLRKGLASPEHAAFVARLEWPSSR